MWSTVEADWKEAGTLARAIVAKRVTVLGGLGIIAGELVRDKVIPTGLATDVTHWATVALTVLGVAAGVLWAQSGTTPADTALAPKSATGQVLVEASTAAGLLAAQATAGRDDLAAAELAQLDQLAANTLAAPAPVDAPTDVPDPAPSPTDTTLAAPAGEAPVRPDPFVGSADPAAMHDTSTTGA